MNNALEAPSLYQAYQEYFPIGAAVTPRQLADPTVSALICRHFDSITAENAMKPENVLNRSATLALGDPIRTAQDFTRVDQMLSFARQNQIRVRFHTLVWHNQTPRWFFAENWSADPDAPLVAPETLLARQEAYIRDVMTHVNAFFPGVVYAWDVVNEALEPEHGAPGGYRTKSLWYQVLKEAFVPAAFRAARRYLLPGQKLYYNDFSTFDPVKREALLSLLGKLREEGLVDGLGMQAHLQYDTANIVLCEEAARAYGKLGLALQVTEMDVHCPGRDEGRQAALARVYGDYFRMLLRLSGDGIPVESATFWGVTDADSWLTGFRKEGSWPLLFTGDRDVKPAFRAVLDAPKERQKAIRKK